MKKGFSLAEVLVVIVIIAVLASLVFPIARSAKSRAKETTCSSNLHQIYLAMQMYREDNGEYPPGPGKPFILENPYLGGTRLRCMSKTNKRIIGDYFLNGPPSAYQEPIERDQAVRRWITCRDKRGPEFPIAWDSNHSSQLHEFQNGGAVYLLVRESGQISRVPAKKKSDMLNRDANLPCLLTQGNANL